MTTAPNGWLFWPDASGLTSNEVTLRAELGWTEQIYDRVSSSGELEVLGEGVELSPDDSNDSPRCFNCGSTSHMMTSCPAPRNQALISLSRSLYQFYRHGAVSEPPRLHVAEEWKLARLRWLDEFVPGEVKSTRLREALSLKEGDPGENAPWLHNMLVWGYPPGWAGVDDPKRAVLERVISTGDEGFQDDESDVFAIFSNGTDAELLRLREPLKETEHEADEPLVSSNQGNQHKTGDKSHRWAIYQTTLFSSELLPVYTGRPLPALHNDCDESATVYRALMSSAKQTNASHPWRHPDAFSASGSVDWSELYQEGPTSTEAPTGEFSFDPGADSEEMDCSD